MYSKIFLRTKSKQRGYFQPNCKQKLHIQINANENVEGGEGLSPQISASIHSRLDRFSQYITRIEVHLSDEDGNKSGSDKRCLIEARLEGRQPEVTSERATTLEGEYSGTAKKMPRALKTTVGRLNHVKGTDSIRTGDRWEITAARYANLRTMEESDHG